MLLTILIVLLVIALLGWPGGFGPTHNYGYAPSGIVTVIIIILVVLLLTGRLHL